VASAPDVRELVRRDVNRLVHRGLGVRELSRAVGRALARAVPFDGICVLTYDPATLLPTGEYVEHGLPAVATVRLTEIELREPDFNKFTVLARDASPAASLSRATEGDLDRSRRQRELRRPYGFDDELRAAMSGAGGTWGALTLLRTAGSSHFTAAEVSFVASLTGSLADGVRRAALFADAAAEGDAGEAGLLVLATDDTVEMSNAAAGRWLAEMDGAGPDRLPVAVRAVAGRARAAAAGRPDAGLARARSEPGRGVGSRCGVRCSATARTPAPRCCWTRPARPSWLRSSRTCTASPTENAGSPSWWPGDTRPARSPIGCTCRSTRCKIISSPSSPSPVPPRVVILWPGCSSTTMRRD
jgi:hypothetical protein